MLRHALAGMLLRRSRQLMAIDVIFNVYGFAALDDQFRKRVAAENERFDIITFFQQFPGVNRRRHETVGGLIKLKKCNWFGVQHFQSALDNALQNFRYALRRGNGLSDTVEMIDQSGVLNDRTDLIGQRFDVIDFLFEKAVWAARINVNRAEHLVAEKNRRA
jgi:hypothetical protein